MDHRTYDTAGCVSAIDATLKHKRGIERLLDDLFGKRYQLAHGGK